jgi:phenylacetate-CoA ligase
MVNDVAANRDTAAAPSAHARRRERVQALAAEMMQRERWPRARLRAHQQAQLRALLRHATVHSPYWRDAIGPIAANDTADSAADDIALAALPTLDKATLMAQFDRIVTDRRLRLPELEQHLAGAHATEPWLDTYRVVGSGGTSGQRGVVVYDDDAWDTALASVQRVLALQDMAPPTRLLGIGAPTPLHMTHRLFAELRGGRDGGAPRLAVTTPMAEMVQALNAFQPEALITYPSVIRRLADEQQAGRLHIAPRKLSSCAETLTPDVRARAAQAWDAPVLDVYACTEACVLGVECPWHHGLHVPEDLVLLEVLDAQHRPVPPGVVGDKVLVTVLFNRTLPLIRYELPDLASVAAGPCPCGRAHLRLAAVRGRREDVIELPARHGGAPVRLHAFLLGETLLHLPQIRQYQLSPLADGLLVRVVLRDPALAPHTLAQARDAVAAELQRAGALASTLTVQSVDSIQRAGAAAKERAVSA